MDDDLFTYEVEVANIPCDSNKDDDSEQRVSHEADDDMGYDPSDKALWIYWIRGDAEVELTDEEFSNNEDEVVETYLLTKDIEGFKTYEEYKDDWIYEWNRDVPWVDEKPWTDTRDYEWYEALMDCELKEHALRNKAIMEGLISDDESCNDGWRRWESHEITYHDHDENESHDERQELCETHELPVCNMRIFKMAKYSFGQDEEYVANKEDEYDDLAKTSDDACRAYQEIFHMMDEGWMVTRAE
ncbi:hypothetical protein Tco_0123738 [Tanacetum coccineum]